MARINSYEKLAKMMNNKARESAFFIGRMDGKDTCKVNELPLGKEDLYINDYYMQSGTRPLEKGDIVVLAKINSEKYAVLCRVV